MTKNSNGKDDPSDPAPTPLAMASSRAMLTCSAITDRAIEELRNLRDEIDNQIRALQGETKIQADGIVRLAELAASAMELKNVVIEPLARLTSDIRRDITPVSKPIEVKENDLG